MFNKLVSLDQNFRNYGNAVGEFISPLVLRLLLAWEYFEAGLQKFNGENWFQHIVNNFPFPFSVMNPNISWAMATWFELLGGLALLLGIATRYVSVSLIVLTLVATVAVHVPSEGWASFGDILLGYSISDNGYGNYKLPLMYLVMFIPLLFTGPGKVSLDYYIERNFHKNN